MGPKGQQVNNNILTKMLTRELKITLQTPFYIFDLIIIQMLSQQSFHIILITTFQMN